MKQALIIEFESPAVLENFSLIEPLSLTQFDLICIVGRDCSAWVNIVDEILVGPTGNSRPIPVTTSHPGEKLAEVQNFANGFFKNEKLRIKRYLIRKH